MKEQTATWSRIWRADVRPMVDESLDVVGALRREVLDEGLPPPKFMPADVRAAAKSFPKKTGIGGDGVRFVGIAAASDEAVEHLWFLLFASAARLILPLQAFLLLMTALPKKSGGSRLIALMCTFYRLLQCLMKPDLRKWDGAAAGHGDTAKPGASPLMGAVRRLFHAEVARWRGKRAALLLWDVAKFFDTISVKQLATSVRLARMPMRSTVRAMMAHRGPRRLKVQGGHVGTSIPATGRSVVAGCGTSVSKSRASLHGVGGGQPVSHERIDYQYVDDIAQYVEANSAHALICRSVRAGQEVAGKLQSLELEIRDKSCVVATSLKDARGIARRLRGMGYPKRGEAMAEDFGVSLSAAARRTTRTSNSRMLKGKLRAMRGGRLVRVSAKAQKLYRAGTAAMQEYGCVACGAAPSQIRMLRQAATASVAPAGTKACSFTLICWRLGAEHDPAVRMVVDQVKLWLRLWQEAGDCERGRVREAWNAALPRILRGSIHWNRAIGPLQGTIATVGALGWLPARPDHWWTDSKTAIVVPGIRDWSVECAILESVRASALKNVWKGTAGHFMGSGLQSGKPLLDPALDAKRHFGHEGRSAEARALDMVVCGGSWPADRDGLVSSKLCKACGGLDSAWHRYWSCPALLSDEQPAEVQDTNWLRGFFESGGEADGMECL